MSTEAVYILLPEIILVLAATAVYLGGAFFPLRNVWSWCGATAILLAGVALYEQSASESLGEIRQAVASIAHLTADPFALAVRFGALGLGLVFVMLSARWSDEDESSEFMGSLLLIVAGAMLLSMAADLIVFFVALELISIPTYVVLYLGRGSGLLESGTKYFFLSVLSSALLLYGFSFLYGAGGSTNLAQIREVLAAAGGEPAGAAAFAPLALVLIFAGVGFRLAAVPFHFYAPDVYQGTTNRNAGILATIPKVAAIVVLVRIGLVAMPGLERLGWQLCLCIAIITMTLGNLVALWQSNVRRLLAYSSIAHAGYLLIGLAVGFAVAGGATEAQAFDGIGASLFYLLVYVAATAGAFAALAYLGSSDRSVDGVDELAGLSTSYPKTAAAIAVFMFSLTGLPPLAGFWGKFALFTGALGVDAKNPEASTLWPWFVALAVIGALNAAISAGYYLRIVAVMYFRPAVGNPRGEGGPGAAWATAFCALAVLGIGCLPGPFIAQADRASQAARATGSTAVENPTAQRVRPSAATQPLDDLSAANFSR
ncbi:MAG TPA: NADH-quinone oxidoreductase subunit N [Pirellulales bacterium]|jgi:NADH-quinone oxidoreductase subunit N|nr:NADH-quinone oxidoreductase subunit N [Pirellulales bacterium]